MSLPAYAVTPSDTRPAPRGSLHPANVASREHSAQAMNLALEIADDAVRSDVEIYSAICAIDCTLWCDTRNPPADMDRHEADRELSRHMVGRALQYIGLRNPDGMPWRFIRHPERPELVRFEAAT